MAGWRYTANIPSYITGKDAEGEPVVLYRVNVLLQSTDAAEAGAVPNKTPFFVLRRYSHFRQLYEQLKSQFPDVMKGKGMSPPAKHPLMLGDKRDMLEHRREELERWLWRLISTPEVARCTYLKAFLEFEKALQRAQQQRLSALSPSLSTPPAASAASSEAGDFDDAHSEISRISATPSGSIMSAFAPASVSGHGTLGASGSRAAAYHPHHQQHVHAHGGMAGASDPSNHGSEGGVAGPPAASLRVAIPPSSLAGVSVAGVRPGAVEADSSIKRLGLKLESRGDVRRLVDTLYHRLHAACTDMSASAHEVALLTEANKLLSGRVQELEEQLGGGRSTREVELEEQLLQVQATMQQLGAERLQAQDEVLRLEEAIACRTQAHEKQVHALQEQLHEAQRDNQQLLGRLQDWDVGAGRSSSEQEERLQRRVHELEALLADTLKASAAGAAGDAVPGGALQTQRAPAHACSDGAQAGPVSQLGGEAVGVLVAGSAGDGVGIGSSSERVAELEGQLAAAAAERDEVASRVAVLQAEVAALKDQAVHDREKVRTDQKLLAKEIQRLRGELAAADKAKAGLQQQLAAGLQELQHLQEQLAGSQQQLLDAQQARGAVPLAGDSAASVATTVPAVAAAAMVATPLAVVGATAAEEHAKELTAVRERVDVLQRQVEEGERHRADALAASKVLEEQAQVLEREKGEARQHVEVLRQRLAAMEVAREEAQARAAALEAQVQELERGRDDVAAAQQREQLVQVQEALADRDRRLQELGQEAVALRKQLTQREEDAAAAAAQAAASAAALAAAVTEHEQKLGALQVQLEEARVQLSAAAQAQQQQEGQLQQREEQLQQQVEALRCELAVCNEQLAELQQRADGAAADAAAATAALAAAAAEHEQQLACIQGHLASAQQAQERELDAGVAADVEQQEQIDALMAIVAARDEELAYLQRQLLELRQQQEQAASEAVAAAATAAAAQEERLGQLQSELGAARELALERAQAAAAAAEEQQQQVSSTTDALAERDARLAELQQRALELQQQHEQVVAAAAADAVAAAEALAAATSAHEERAVSLQGQLAAAEDQLRQLQQAVAGSADQQQHQLQELSATLAARNQQLTALQDALDALRLQHEQQAEASTSAASAAEAAVAAAATEHEAQLSELREQLAVAQEQLEALRAVASKQDAQLADLQEELERQREREQADASAIAAAAAAATAAAASHEEQTAQLQGDLAAARELQQHQAAQLAVETEQQVAALTASLEERDRQLAQLQETVSGLQQAAAAAAAEAAVAGAASATAATALEARVAALQAELQAAEEVRRQLEEQAAARQQEVLEQSREAGELAAALADKDTQLAQLQQAVAQLQQQLEQASAAAAAEASTAAAAHQARVSELEAKLAAAEDEQQRHLALLTAALSERDEQLALLQQAVAELQAQRQQQQHAIAASKLEQAAAEALQQAARGDADARLQEATAHGDEFAARIAALEQQLEERQAELAAASEQLAAAAAEHQQLRARLEQATAAAAAAEAMVPEQRALSTGTGLSSTQPEALGVQQHQAADDALAEHEHQQLAEHADALQRQLAELQEELAAARQQVAQLQAAGVASPGRGATGEWLASENVALLERVTGLEAQLADAISPAAQLTALQQERAQLLQRLQAADAAAAAAVAESISRPAVGAPSIGGQSSVLSGAPDELVRHQLEQDNEALRQQVNAVHEQLAAAEAAAAAAEQRAEAAASAASPSTWSSGVAPPLGADTQLAEQLQQLQRLLHQECDEAASLAARLQQAAAAAPQPPLAQPVSAPATAPVDLLSDDLLSFSAPLPAQATPQTATSLSLLDDDFGPMVGASDAGNAFAPGALATAAAHASMPGNAVETVHLMQQQCQQLRGALGSLQAACNRLVASLGGAQRDADALRLQLQQRSGGPASAGPGPGWAGDLIQQAEGLLRELRHCDSDVAAACEAAVSATSVGAAGRGAATPAAATEQALDKFLQRCSESTSRMEALAGQVKALARPPSGAGAAPAAADGSAALRGVLSGLLGDLEGMYRTRQEVRCDQVLASVMQGGVQADGRGGAVHGHGSVVNGFPTPTFTAGAAPPPHPPHPMQHADSLNRQQQQQQGTGQGVAAGGGTGMGGVLSRLVSGLAPSASGGAAAGPGGAHGHTAPAGSAGYVPPVFTAPDALGGAYAGTGAGHVVNQNVLGGLGQLMSGAVGQLGGRPSKQQQPRPGNQ